MFIKPYEVNTKSSWRESRGRRQKGREIFSLELEENERRKQGTSKKTVLMKSLGKGRNEKIPFPAFNLISRKSLKSHKLVGSRRKREVERKVINYFTKMKLGRKRRTLSSVICKWENSTFHVFITHWDYEMI